MDPVRIRVSPDGRGDYRTIEAALKYLRSAKGPGAAEISVTAGVYREKLVIDVPKVTLRGEGATATRIVWGDSAHLRDETGEELGTFRTATLRVQASDVALIDLTIENDAGPGEVVEQAVAAYIAGDRATLRACRLLGHQDTLLLGPDWYNPREVCDEGCRVYLDGCTIVGNFDFIFGSYRSWFEGCTIHCLPHPQAIITAPNSPQGQPFGFVFHGCRITGEGAPHSVYLGRPWRPYGRVAFLACDHGDRVAPAGWLDWAEPFRAVHAGMCEYACTETGGMQGARHASAGQLDATQAVQYTRDAVLGGTDGWQPWIP